MWNLDNSITEEESSTKFQPLNKLKVADYSPNYSGTGENMNITLHQSYLNNSFGIELNASDPSNNTFYIPCPTDTTFNSSYTKFEIEDIYAPNKTLIVEDDLSGGDMLGGGSGLNSHYISFETIGNGYIETINMSLRESVGAGATLTIYLFNATNNGGNIEPDSAVYGTPIVNVAPITGSTYKWYNFTGIHSLFNSSKTYNNTFFFRLDEGGLGTIQVGGAWDNTISPDLVDESLVYQSDGTTLETSAGITVDAGLILELTPTNNTPKPSEINLIIDNDYVEDRVQDRGYWESYDVNSSATGELKYNLTAEWWDVTCNVSQVQINYTKSDLVASSEFNIVGSGQIVEWNVTRNGGLNYFYSGFDNYQINFTIPDTWDEESIRVFNGAVPKTSDSTNRSLGNAYRDVNVINAGNGTFWYLTANSTNLLSSIDTYIGSTPETIFNYTDITHFNSTFSEVITDGIINLSVYSPVLINNELNYSIKVESFTPGSVISLTNWDISDNVTQYGGFRVHVYWNNNTAAGFLEKIITILGETELKPTLPAYTFDASDTFDFEVYFNDTGLAAGIDGADITYRLGNGAIRSDDIDHNNGTYTINIDCNDTDFSAYGPNLIEINASKAYYNNQSEVEQIIILGETNLTSSILKSSFDSTETFNISLFFNDTVKNSGVFGAIRNVYANSTLLTPISSYDYGDGNYNITVDCDDNIFDSWNYGYFNLSVDVEKSYYYNQSTWFIIYITGETSLSTSKFPEPIIGYYNSDEIFNITAYYEDIGRSEGINGGVAKIYVKEVAAPSYQEYTPVIIDPYGVGYYNLTVNCSDPIFRPYGKYNIKINITRQNYYTAEDLLLEIVVGNTTLTILEPTMPISYVEDETFDIMIEYKDHTLSTRITGANITYTIDGTNFRSDSISPNVDDTYNITIDAGDVDFETNYGYVNIIIRANKSNYINLTRTFTFERQIKTQITPFNNPPIMEVKRGLNVSYTFNYSDTSGNPIIEYDNFQRTSPFVGFQYYLRNDGNGNYTLNVDTTNVGVRVDPYTLNFTISAFGNQSQEISLTILLTIIQTRVEIQSWNNNTDFDRITWTNVSVNFYFNDTTNIEAIDGLLDSNIIVKDYYAGTTWTPGFELFNQPGPGNYKLNISTVGKNSGLYTLQINVSKYPDYNWSLTYIQFYLRGNYTQINMISVSDLEALLPPTGIGNNYTTFLGSDLTLEFNITDTEWNNNVVTQVPSNYFITFKNIKTGMTGTLQESLLFVPLTPYSHTGDILTSALTDTGFYLINITVVMLNYENSTFSFNLTLVDSQINIIAISNQGGQLFPSGVENYYNSTVALDLNFEFNIIDTESLNKTIARDATSYLVRYINLGTGQNGTILNGLAFNPSTSNYIGTITTSGLGVGNYLINVSVVILNYKTLPITFNLTLVYANSSIISISNRGGQLTPSIIDNFYDTFIGSNIGIEFNISDVHFDTNIQIGAGISYSVYYQNIDTLAGGSLQHTLSEVISLHSGFLNISQLSVGNYSFSIIVAKSTNNVTSVNFLLRIVEKYETRITVYKPESVNAGLPFTIIIKAEYFNGTVWLPTAGSNMTITLCYNGGAGESQDYYTNSTGEIEIIIPTYSDTITLNLTIQLISAYYHQGYGPDVSDIDIIPIPSGFGFEDILLYLIIAGIAIAAVGGSVGIYRGVVVPKKREKSRVLKEVKTIFDDAINLEHILVLYKGTGTCVYFKSFGSEGIDPELISGFISAICSFGKDLVCQEELNEITYGDKMLLLSDGEFIRVALVLSKKASIILSKNLMDFINGFEKSYASELPNWRGQLNIFRNAGRLVDEILSTSIILPHEITYEFSNIKALKNPHSKDVLKVANTLLKDSDRSFFFIATLLKEATEKTHKDTAEIFMGIKELRDKKILIPIEIGAIEAQPISQQELALINQKVARLVNLSQEEKQKLVNDLAQVGPAEREAYFVSLMEQHEIVSAPIEEKPGATLIDNVKGAKKEINKLKKIAKTARKEKDYGKTINIYQDAVKIASSWELAGELEQLNEFIRSTKIEDLRIKMKTLEKEAKLAAKEEKYNEAAQKYKMSSKIASEIFKLGGTEMTKEVKRLSNKSKEYEKLI